MFAGLVLSNGCSFFENRIQNPSDIQEPKVAPETPPEIAETKAVPIHRTKVQSKDLPAFCQRTLLRLPGRPQKAALEEACQQVRVLPTCKQSVNGQPIFHFQKTSPQVGAEKILVFGLVHGDEPESGVLARTWMERLTKIDSRSSWRIIPISNPDGVDKKTRMNARGVDLNRNFPTKDWSYSAHTYWKTKKKGDPRRYPGPSASSEPETRCYLSHIADFSPTFIISLHTPYGLLDFDGPQLAFPPFKNLPWSRLGHFPGSLGRYMWYDQGVPVLTVELTKKVNINNIEELYNLQDLAGLVAIRSVKFLKKSSFPNQFSLKGP